MDNVTHTLFALTLARTPLGDAGRGTTLALVISSNAPDIDAISALGGGAFSYLQWHRGPTHGLVGIVGLGAVTAASVWLVGRLHAPGDRKEPQASFAMLLGVSMIGVLCHVLMDLPTSYGTRLLSPFDWHWYAIDWLPIIDIYLLIGLAAALLFGAGSHEARRRNAAIALTLMAANYGLRAAAHHRALVLAPVVFGPTLPQPCGDTVPESILDSWPQVRTGATRAPSARRCLVELAAMPTFVSPFRWRIVAHFSNGYELHDVDVLDPRFVGPDRGPSGAWRTSLRYPDVWTPQVFSAARSQSAQVFLGFSRFPAVRAFTDPTGATTVRWSDLRFAGGVLTLQESAQRPQPFTATIRVAADGGVLTQGIER